MPVHFFYMQDEMGQESERGYSRVFQRENGKRGLKNDLEYFWMYHKFQVIAVLIVMFMAIYFLISSLTQKECVLSVMLIDCHTDVSSEQMEKEYMWAAGLDEKNCQVQIQNNLMFQGTDSGNYTMASLSKFMTDIGSQKLDVCGMLEDDFLKYDKSGTYMDLRNCLTEEELDELKGNLCIAEDGRVIGIYTQGLSGLVAYGCYELQNGRAIIGIIYNTPHEEEAVNYLRYLV